MRPTPKRPIARDHQEVESTAANVLLLGNQGRANLARPARARPLPTTTFGGPSQPPQSSDIPPWFTAFDLASNTRFTRTPDHVLRRRQAGDPAEPTPALPRATGGYAPVEPTSRGRAEPSHEAPSHDLQDDLHDDLDVAGFDQADRDWAAEQPFDDVDEPCEAAEAAGELIRAEAAGDVPSYDEDDVDDASEAEEAVAAFVATLSGPPSLPFLGYGPISLSADLTWQAMRRRRAAPARVEHDEEACAEPALPPPAPEVPVAVARPVAQRMEPGEYVLPPLELLAEATFGEPPYEASAEYLDRSSVTLQQTLHDFGVRGEVIDANPGPVVTLYEFEPAPGTKSSRVIGLSGDVARSMAAVSARVAVVPGRNVIGIELPNQTREMVYLRELLETEDFSHSKHRLAVALGKTIGGEPIIADLARMPHLLVAGTTGSGKSVAINTMILSLLYMHKPEQCRLIMVDPKMLELSVYEGIPHLLTPVVTDPKKAVIALKWAVREMEERYKKMSRLSVRNIDGFNVRVAEAKARGEVITRSVQTGFNKTTGEAIFEDEPMDLEPLPYIVVIVDEMADLMMVAGKDIEGAIQRLAQMARAAGIHLIMATQRPSVDVITGTIKANFPTRISFQVTSKIDSRTILGEMGAEQLLGQGDMLYMAGGGRITRVHGPFVSDGEVEKVVDHLKAQGRPQYLDSVTVDEEGGSEALEEGAIDEAPIEVGDEDADPYDQAVAVVLRDRKASTSYIQRRLGIGYNRAASIMERMEKEGLVGPANHAGKRAIHAGEGRHDADY
ncbi:DNA translocase FtsK [Enterovirga rhinocerotis]|nr:DNA translocase FtsK [Enterovirga rhinocerotis]